jgi:hypothetical protein
MIGMGRPPAANRFKGNPEKVRHFAFRVTEFTAPQGTQTQRFENFVR